MGNEFIFDWVPAFVISVIASTIGAFIILKILSLFYRPKIEISPQIAKLRDGYFHIKIINRSPRPAMKIRLWLYKIIPAERGRGIPTPNFEPIKIDKSEIHQLTAYRKDDKEDNYCWRIGIIDQDKDIEEFWKKNPKMPLRFLVDATDSVSNLEKIFIQDYHSEDRPIVPGDFETGNSMKITDLEKNRMEEKKSSNASFIVICCHFFLVFGLYIKQLKLYVQEIIRDNSVYDKHSTEIILLKILDKVRKDL